MRRTGDRILIDPNLWGEKREMKSKPAVVLRVVTITPRTGSAFTADRSGASERTSSLCGNLNHVIICVFVKTQGCHTQRIG